MPPVTEVVTPDWDKREIIRTKSDATEERATMEKGPEGFIIGKFETGVVTLDAPNLLLVPKIIKRPASEAAKKKKPAAGDGTGATDPMVGEDADVADASALWETPEPKQAEHITRHVHVHKYAQAM